jgi:hypothetical protein
MAIEIFPMTVTILKSESQIKIYGLPKFPKPKHIFSTSLECGINMDPSLLCPFYCGVGMDDVEPTTYPHHH